MGCAGPERDGGRAPEAREPMKRPRKALAVVVVSAAVGAGAEYGVTVTAGALCCREEAGRGRQPTNRATNGLVALFWTCHAGGPQ